MSAPSTSAQPPAARPRRIVVFGPGPAFKGGISAYTVSLARALEALSTPERPLEVHLVSWTQQYPALIPRDFADRASRTHALEGTRVQVHYVTNYNNPLSWARTVGLIRRLGADTVVLQWAIALQGLPLGWMARQLMRVPGLELLFDCHLVVQKEASALDRWFTRYGLGRAHGYIVHAQKTAAELRQAFAERAFVEVAPGAAAPAGGGPYILPLFHPVYDLHPSAPIDRAALKAELGLRRFVFLFFGFIRPYKGLHHCLAALAEFVRRYPAQAEHVSLLIAGESFWKTVDTTSLANRVKSALFALLSRLLRKSSANEQDYNPLALIDTLGLSAHVALVNRYIANEEVAQYWQVADAVLLFYETATPSGVESQAYHFGLPMLATRVGHFEETIRPGDNGYLAPSFAPADLADTLLRAIEQPIAGAHIRAAGARLSWSRYAQAILAARGSSV